MDVPGRTVGFELMQDAPIVAVHVDAAGIVDGWNGAAAALFAVDEADALGRPISEVAPGPGGAAAWQAMLGEGRGARRVWTTRRDGHAAVTCTWTVQPLPGGGAMCYAEPLRVRDLLLQALLDNLEIVAWVTDAEGTCLLIDGKGLAATGLTAEMLLGNNVTAAFGAKYPEILDALRGRPGRFTSNEGAGHFENWALPMRGDAGEVVALAGISLDVTRARTREAELQNKLDVIERQQRAMREMSTPIIEVWDQVICLPIVGLVDTARAADVMDNLLQSVARTRARFAILDLTGVEVVDTATASHLLGLIRALRLLGAEGVLTGVHPNIAQTVVTLGIDLSGLTVRATLRDALKYALKQLERR